MPWARSGSVEDASRRSAAGSGWPAGPGRPSACPAASRAAAHRAASPTSVPSKSDLALGRPDQPQQRPAQGGLAAAGLPHQAEGLALAGSQVDPVDRLHLRRPAVQHQPSRIGKCTLSPARTTSELMSAPPAAPSPAAGSTAAQPRRSSSRTPAPGVEVVQVSILLRHRGRERAARRPRERSGSATPGIGRSGAAARRVEPRDARQQPAGVRVPRSRRTAASRVAGLDDPPGVHHVDLVAQARPPRRGRG